MTQIKGTEQAAFQRDIFLFSQDSIFIKPFFITCFMLTQVQ